MILHEDWDLITDEWDANISLIVLEFQEDLSDRLKDEIVSCAGQTSRNRFVILDIHRTDIKWKIVSLRVERIAGKFV